MKFKTNNGNTLSFSSFEEFVKRMGVKLRYDRFLLEDNNIYILDNIDFVLYDEICSVELNYFNDYLGEEVVKKCYFYKKSTRIQSIGDYIVKDGKIYHLRYGYCQYDSKNIRSSDRKKILNSKKEFEKKNGDIAQIRDHLVFDGCKFYIEEDENNIVYWNEIAPTKCNFNRKYKGIIEVPFDYSFKGRNSYEYKNGDELTDSMPNNAYGISRNYFNKLKKEIILKELKERMDTAIRKRNFKLTHGGREYVFNQQLNGHKDWDNFFKKISLLKKLKTKNKISARSLLKLKTFYQGNHYGYRLGLSIVDNCLIITSQGRDYNNDRERAEEIRKSILIDESGKVDCKEVLEYIS